MLSRNLVTMLGRAATAAALAAVCIGTPIRAGEAQTTLTNVPVPQTGAYLGAAVNPDGTANSPTAIEAATVTLEGAIAPVKLTLHMHYFNWDNGTSDQPSDQPGFVQTGAGNVISQELSDDASVGRTPVISWRCDDAPTGSITDENLANGQYDTLIQHAAQAMVNYGKPVFIRWYWEMNLTEAANGDGTWANGQNCLGGGSLQNQQHWFVMAWQHIRTIFVNAGATNVSWLWNPSADSRDPDASGFYPAPNAGSPDNSPYVDWIGVDAYDKIGANNFGPVLSGFYTEYANYGKPILVGETGECQPEQATYLASAQAEMSGSAVVGKQTYSFPLIKGLMYFDVPGTWSDSGWGEEHSTPWNFEYNSSTGYFGPGIAQFSTMANSSFFSVKP